MPISVEWDNPDKTVMRWDFKGSWTPAEWLAAAQRSVRLRETVLEKPVVVAILNLKHSGVIPVNILPHARIAAEMMDPRDYVIITHASGFVRSMIEVFRYLNPTLTEKVVVTETLDDARQIISSEAFIEQHESR